MTEESTRHSYEDVDGPPLQRDITVQRVATFGWQLLRRISGFIFSFEFIFVLFLFAGNYKADPRFSWITVDLTALLFGLNLIVGLYILVRRGLRFERAAFTLAMIFLVFVAYGAFSLVWTPGSFYATEKASQLATLNFWALTATATIIAFSRRRLHRFLLALAIFSSWITFETILSYRQPTLEDDYYLTALGAYYLGVGRVVGLGALIILAYSLFWAPTRWLKIAALTLVGIFSYLLLIIGGRGPLLATVLAAFVPLLVGWRFTVADGTLTLKRYLMPFITVIGLSFVIVASAFGTISQTPAVSRLFMLFRPGMESSAATRIAYYTDTIPLWSENPIFGYGIGSWPIVMGFGDVRSYVHNIFLEIMFELGLVGLLLFIGLLAFALQSLGPWRLIRNDPLRVLVLMLFVDLLVNALVTGDLNYNRGLFAVLGLMVIGRRGSLRA